MQCTAFPIPTWAPAAAAAGLVVWAVSIWWMVASLPAGGDTTTVEAGITALATEIETTHRDIEALTAEVESLRFERDRLASRLDALESRSTVSGAFEMSTAAEANTVEDGAGISVEDDGVTALATHPLFTNGADRYNCRDFTSFEEAQEALRVNRPGDPNRIDMNDNGVACEDFRYPVPRDTTAP